MLKKRLNIFPNCCRQAKIQAAPSTESGVYTAIKEHFELRAVPQMGRTASLKRGLFLINVISLLCFMLSPLATAHTLPDFTGLVEKLSPTVVNISTKRTVIEKRNGFNDDLADLSNLLSRRFGFAFPLPPKLAPRPDIEREIRSLGSGFITDSAGYIVTNAHVIANADEIVVHTFDKRKFSAKVVGADARTDVALLKINMPKGTKLPMVTIGDSKALKVGEWVLAIGSPFGFENTVTKGIVSAKERELIAPGASPSLIPYIQTDVPINPGNSGGPLFDMNGKVVGINAQIYSRTSGFMGLSFSIPINDAMYIVNELKTAGRVKRGFLGVFLQGLDLDLAKSFGLEKPTGVLLTSIEKKGPADQAGLKAGDIILKYDTQTISSVSDLRNLVAKTSPGSKVAVDIWRQKKAHRLTVTVGTAPEQNNVTAQYSSGPKKIKIDSLGLSLYELNRNDPNSRDVIDKMGNDLQGGLVVDKVSGIAKEAGLIPDDVIVDVNGEKIISLNQFNAALEKAGVKKIVALRVMRRVSGNGFASIYVTLKIPQEK